MTKNIIEFKNVTKTYEDSGTTVLKDITFEIEEGKFYTLLGASGSGKSTILNIIAGLLDATSGDILLDGQRRVRGFFDFQGLIWFQLGLENFLVCFI